MHLACFVVRMPMLHSGRGTNKRPLLERSSTVALSNRLTRYGISSANPNPVDRLQPGIRTSRAPSLLLESKALSRPRSPARLGASENKGGRVQTHTRVQKAQRACGRARSRLKSARSPSVFHNCMHDGRSLRSRAGL